MKMIEFLDEYITSCKSNCPVVGTLQLFMNWVGPKYFGFLFDLNAGRKIRPLKYISRDLSRWFTPRRWKYLDGCTLAHPTRSVRLDGQPIPSPLILMPVDIYFPVATMQLADFKLIPLQVKSRSGESNGSQAGTKHTPRANQIHYQGTRDSGSTKMKCGGEPENWEHCNNSIIFSAGWLPPPLEVLVFRQRQ